jgi:hypothetical protein
VKRDIVIFFLGLLTATSLAAITALLTSRTFLEVVFLFYVFFGVFFVGYLEWRTPIVTGDELQRKLEKESKAQARKLNRK